MSIPPITGIERYVDAEGRLTFEGQKVLTAMAGILEAIGDVSKPSGGATVDAEARTAIDAIIDAAT